MDAQQSSQSQSHAQSCDFCPQHAQQQCIGCQRHLCQDHLWVEEYRPLCPVCSGDAGVQYAGQHES